MKLDRTDNLNFNHSSQELESYKVAGVKYTEFVLEFVISSQKLKNRKMKKRKNCMKNVKKERGSVRCIFFRPFFSPNIPCIALLTVLLMPYQSLNIPSLSSICSQSNTLHCTVCPLTNSCGCTQFKDSIIMTSPSKL